MNHMHLAGKKIVARGLSAMLEGTPASVRRRTLSLYLLLIGVNVGAWLWALLAFHSHPVLLGSALLAYGFGLRHAIDADHVAAIDNVTRKLMQQGRRPVAVGFYFSLGHSTVVFALSAIIAATSVALKNHFQSLASIGGVIGTSVSAFFLLAIAAANLMVFISLCQTFLQVRQGGRIDEDSLNLLLAKRGFFGRLFRNLFRMIEHGWQMYLVGLLFGLGFDTATEVGLLGISATQAAAGLSPWAILIFPALFTVGMALVDSTVNILMLNAYGWAFVKPIRKLYYNLTITLVSVLVAVVIGGTELLGMAGDHVKIHGLFWNTVSRLNDHLGMAGLAIILLFVACWMISLLVYRFNRYDEIEVNTDPVA